MKLKAIHTSNWQIGKVFVYDGTMELLKEAALS